MTITDQEAIDALVERLRDERHLMQGDGLSALIATASAAADALTAERAKVEALEARGEPVAWERKVNDHDLTMALAELEAGQISIYGAKQAILKWAMLYAAPPAPTVTVTDEMVERALKAWWSRMGDRGRSDDQLMRETLLAALGDKP